MTDNVVDARERFEREKKDRQRTVLDELRETVRVVPEDRVLLAQGLGKTAAEISPERPDRAAKLWFNEAWEGDRWAKRKRFICYPGETPSHPFDEGAYAASGADWAALIDRAAKARYPTDGPTADAERARVGRDILRGTAFPSALPLVPPSDENAPSLLADWARRITKEINGETDLHRLWDALKTTPFDTYAYDPERQEPLPYRRARFEGDNYSLGPLEAVSKRATELYQQNGERGWRFELIEERKSWSASWTFPSIGLGLRGHQRKGRIFVIPEGFWKELQPGNDFEPGEAVFEWLMAKGLISREGIYDDGLPDIPFDENAGYGWKPFAAEYPESVWLSARLKDDGTTGLWLSTSMIIFEDFYPEPTYGFDALARVAEMHANRSQYLVSAWGDRECEDYHWPYHMFTWPTKDDIFSPNDTILYGAVSGIVDLELLHSEGTGGWIDDLDNAELHDILFRNSEGVRFCHSIAIDEDWQPPCQKNTIAAAIFANRKRQAEDRLGQRLVDEARTISSAGLAFYDALIAQNRALVEGLFDE